MPYEGWILRLPWNLHRMDFLVVHKGSCCLVLTLGGWEEKSVGFILVANDDVLPPSSSGSWPIFFLESSALLVRITALRSNSLPELREDELSLSRWFGRDGRGEVYFMEALTWTKDNIIQRFLYWRESDCKVATSFSFTCGNKGYHKIRSDVQHVSKHNFGWGREDSI